MATHGLDVEIYSPGRRRPDEDPAVLRPATIYCSALWVTSRKRSRLTQGWAAIALRSETIRSLLRLRGQRGHDQFSEETLGV